MNVGTASNFSIFKSLLLTGVLINFADIWYIGGDRYAEVGEMIDMNPLILKSKVGTAPKSSISV